MTCASCGIDDNCRTVELCNRSVLDLCWLHRQALERLGLVTGVAFEDAEDRRRIEDESMLPPPEVIDSMMKHCRCCPCCRNPPCAGVMAGGLCDEMPCRFDTEDDFDDPIDPQDEEEP